MSTSIISGKINAPDGTSLNNIRVTCVLRPRPAFKTSTGAELASITATVTAGTGDYSFTLERTADITPAGSYYEITEYIPDHYGGPVKHTIQVGSSNTTVLASLVSQPPAPTPTTYLTQAAADARYVQSPGSFATTGNISTIDPDDAADGGALSTYARGDHQHAITAATAGESRPADTAAEGSASSFARSDHRHDREIIYGTAAERAALSGTDLNNGLTFTESDTGKVYMRLAGAWVEASDLNAWDSYTPTVSQGVSTNISKTVNFAQYTRQGRLISGTVYVTLTAGGTAGSDAIVTLPVTSAWSAFQDMPLGVGVVFDTSTGLYYICAARQASTTTVKFTVGSAGSWGNNPNLALATGDILQFSFQYEAAS